MDQMNVSQLHHQCDHNGASSSCFILRYPVCSDESCRNNGGSRGGLGVAQLPRGGGKLIKRMCQTSEAAKLGRPPIIPFAFA